MNIFHCEENIAIAAIVGALTALIPIVVVFLSKSMKADKINLLYALTGVSLLCSIVATLFSYNIIVVVGYIISVICSGLMIVKTCSAAHTNTIYNLGPAHLFSKIIIPLSIIFQFFRPIFVYCKDEAQLPYYKLLAGIGLKCHNVEERKWATIINSDGIAAYQVNLESDSINFMTILTLLIFVAVLVMQALLIWRQFKDPDNARDWADIGLVITCVGTIFVYGMFTSNNLRIADVKYVENITLTIPVIVILGLLNRVLYFEKVEKLLDKLFAKKA